MSHVILVKAENKAGEIIIPEFELMVPDSLEEAKTFEGLGEVRALKMIHHVMKIEARAKRNPNKKGGTGQPKGTVGRSVKAVKDALKAKGLTEAELEEFIRAKRAEKGLSTE